MAAIQIEPGCFLTDYSGPDDLGPVKEFRRFIIQSTSRLALMQKIGTLMIGACFGYDPLDLPLIKECLANFKKLRSLQYATALPGNDEYIDEAVGFIFGIKGQVTYSIGDSERIWAWKAANGDIFVPKL